MDLVKQHIAACARAIGIPCDKQSMSAWIRERYHPDRVKIESRFGKVFASIEKLWTWKDWKDCQQPRIKQFVAVTSLSPLPKHQERQPVCLNSWKRFGLRIVAVNAADEIDLMKANYPQVDQWIVNNDRPTWYSKPTQYIHSLLHAAEELRSDVLIINSDIEIYGGQEVLIEAAAKGPVVGIRWNYNQSPAGASQEGWGLDAFFVPRELAMGVPEACYAIGRPFWDYWLPYHLKIKNDVQTWIGWPYFYHQAHPLHWTEADWFYGRDWFESHYGVKIDWNEWRDNQPFPPWAR